MVVAGCSTTRQPLQAPQLSVAPGYTAILPTSAVRIGHLYVEGSNALAGFATSAGVAYSRLCYDDFAKTTALKEIAQHVVDEGVTATKRTGTRGITGGLSTSTNRLSFLGSLTVSGDAGTSRTYTVENVHSLILTDEGLDTIRSGIGEKCRALIGEVLSAGKAVVVVRSAERADKATDLAKEGISGTAGASVGGAVSTGEGGAISVTGDGLGGRAGNSSEQSSEYPMVYLSVQMVPFTP